MIPSSTSLNSEKSRHGISAVQPFPHKTALENVMMAPVLVLKQNKEEVRKRAEDLIRKVRLQGKEDSYPGELSGGQQRVAITGDESRCDAF